MKIAVISGSGRKGSESKKIALWCAETLKSLDAKSEVIDVSELNLPVVHEEVWSNVEGKPAMDVRKPLEESDGYIVIVPEWSGMASPALKNYLLYVGKAMAHKPALIVAVSATRNGGSYPIAELRMSSYKNSRIVYMPEHMLIHDVNNVFNTTDPETESSDEYLQHRTRYCIKQLLSYAKALENVRNDSVVDFDTYPHGL